MGSPLLSLVMISSVISALLSSSGLRISDRSFGGASFRLLIHKIPEFLGLRNSQKDCFAIASDVPGNSITAFCCSRLETKNIFSGCLTSIRRDFKCSHISSCSVVFEFLTAHLAELILGSWFPKFPNFLGLWNSQRDCFAIASDVPGNSITAFCCSHLETKKVFSGCLTSIRRDFKCSHISSCSVRRRGKNRGNRRIC